MKPTQPGPPALALEPPRNLTDLKRRVCAMTLVAVEVQDAVSGGWLDRSNAHPHVGVRLRAVAGSRHVELIGADGSRFLDYGPAANWSFDGDVATLASTDSLGRQWHSVYQVECEDAWTRPDRRRGAVSR